MNSVLILLGLCFITSGRGSPQTEITEPLTKSKRAAPPTASSNKCSVAAGVPGIPGFPGRPGSPGPQGPQGPPGPQFPCYIHMPCNVLNEGSVRYNSQKSSLEYCHASQWRSISSTSGQTPRTCEAIVNENPSAKSGIYWIKPHSSKPAFQTFCDMKGGWTLVMKINGIMNTFNYDSHFWTNKASYNSHEMAMDTKETKLASYWLMPFTEIRLGMRRGSTINWISFPFSATSLYDVIREGNFREKAIGRSSWMSLISGSSLQTYCDKQGFNVHVQGDYERVRIGVLGNNEDDCVSPDSFLGFGGKPYVGSGNTNSCGNYVRCCVRNNERIQNIKLMGYIMVR